VDTWGKGIIVTRRLLVILGALALALAALVPAAGADSAAAENAAPKVQKGQYDSYVVVMAADPLLASFDQDALNTPKANRERAKLKAAQKKAMRDAGVSTNKAVNSYTNAANGFSALITHEEAERIAASPGVLMVMPDELRQPTTENSPDFLGLSSPAGAWAKGYTGEDVVVGVIDNGIWPEHPSFADDGSYSDLGITLDESVYSACDFGNTAHNPADAPFECNNKLIGARQVLPTYRLLIGAEPQEFDSARDDSGHGTHTASTAAGNAGVQASIFGIDRGVVSGIAPRARVIAYKGLGELGGFGSDLAAAIDQAVADGVDVINYSIGGGAGLTGADDIAFLFAADAGVFVATSAGNSGPGPDTLGSPGNAPWLTTVGASTQDRTFQGSASSSDGWEFFGASITAGTDELKLVDAADAGDELCNIGALDPAVVGGNIVLCLRGAIARAAKSAAVAEAGGAGMILYNATDTQSQVTDNHSVPSVHINNTDGLVIKDYIAAAGDDAVAQINGGVSIEIDAPWMADFSSRGPNGPAADIIKPDVTAPGVNILAGASPVHYEATVQGELFQSISGTSMSSPHVAGLFALLKQAHPDWSPAAAKSALMTTAYQDVMKEDGVTPADPFDFGAGHVDPSGPVKAWGSIFMPGVVYDAGFNEYLGFLCDAAPEVFANPAATCAALAAAGIPTDASDLNLASIGIAELAGTQTVTRTVTNVSGRPLNLHAAVDAPAGYDVDVYPSKLKLRPGASASYEVTITATESAAIDEWAFGSLTWKSGRLQVRSPIAVRAQLFNAPAAVTGSGVDGSASFDVTFGYSGDYAAAAHGLESAVVINDTVVQDPDQNFDPNDGFSNAHVFTTTGAAFVRFAMPPDAVPSSDHDIDIFLYDSAGNQVASSTSGGTDEEISIVLPPDDTWTLYVHGWQTVTGAADYTLYAWIVSATPGGNMTVDSAPASATLGATETVSVSWTGATAGEWHLGAVSHADANGLIGLTLIEVDNR
jgi:subtilisin family serine protease